MGTKQYYFVFVEDYMSSITTYVDRFNTILLMTHKNIMDLLPVYCINFKKYEELTNKLNKIKTEKDTLDIAENTRYSMSSYGYIYCTEKITEEYIQNFPLPTTLFDCAARECNRPYSTGPTKIMRYCKPINSEGA